MANRAYTSFSFAPLADGVSGEATFTELDSFGFSVSGSQITPVYGGEATFAFRAQVAFAGINLLFEVLVDGAVVDQITIADDWAYYGSDLFYSGLISVTPNCLVTFRVTPTGEGLASATGTFDILQVSTLPLSSSGTPVSGSSSLAGRLAKTASRLIAKHGAPMVVTARAAIPKRDVSKPWRGSTGTTTVTVLAVQYDYDEEEGKDATWRLSHSRFLIAELDTTNAPQFTSVDLTTATDLTDTSGHVWSIDNVEIVEPGNTRIIYILHVAR